MRPHRLFFGLALVQGAAAIAAWGWFGWSPHGSLGHAHEMVFGQAVAVIGGYLLTRAAGWTLWLPAAAWIAARLVAAWPDLPLEMVGVFSILATAAIAVPALRGFLRGVKRGGNMVFPVLLGGLMAADGWHQLGALGVLPGGGWPGLVAGLGLVALLIAAMGGRLLSAAASGAAQKAGGARIPPRHGLERAVLASLLAGFAAQAVAAPWLASALPLALAGLLLATRIILWAPGLRRAKGDVAALAAGQGWLALGLLAWAGATGGWLPMPGTAALHLATIGGIGGTLLVMMMRSAAQREGRPMPRHSAPLAAGLMAAAALARGFGGPDWGWPAAALLWLVASCIAGGSVFAARGGEVRRQGATPRSRYSPASPPPR